jgi:hypothetical protein
LLLLMKSNRPGNREFSIMTAKQIIETLEPWLAKHRRPAWKPVVVDGDGPPMASKFCGIPWIGPDAAWPNCEVCKKPLQLFLQLDLSDLPEELGVQFGAGLLQLFYCTSNECEGYGGWDPFADDLSRVRIVQPKGAIITRAISEQGSHFPAKRIVGWERFIDVPAPCEHDDLGLKLYFPRLSYKCSALIGPTATSNA